MKKLIFLLSILIVVPIIASDPVEDVKAKWMKWANENVEQEKARCLESIKMTDHFDDPDVRKAALHNFRNGTTKGRFATIKGPTEIAQNTDPIVELAKNILTCPACESIKVLIHNDLSVDFGISRNYDTNTCNLYVPLSELDKKIDHSESLLHEKAHIIYEDSLNHEKMGILSQKSGLFKNKIQSANHSELISSYLKAQETRADVYATIISPQYGDNLCHSFQEFGKEVIIDFGIFRVSTVPIFGSNHPHPKDRIALLQQIKSELQDAEQEKRYMTTAMQAMSDDQLV